MSQRLFLIVDRTGRLRGGRGEGGDHLIAEGGGVEAGALGVGGGGLESVEERIEGPDVERGRGGLGVEAAEDLGAEAIEDLVEGDLDGVGVLEGREGFLVGAVVVVVVVVAEDGAAESGGAAGEADAGSKLWILQEISDGDAKRNLLAAFEASWTSALSL